MYRLLAVNEFQALYEYRSDAPDQPIEPFSYLNDLLSVRSAAGFVSFLKNHPQGLRELERSHTLDWEVKLTRIRIPRSSRFDYSEKAIMNAATARGVDYLDAMTDTSGHFDEVSAHEELSNRLRTFVDKHGRDAVWTQELEAEYVSLWDGSPKADLFRLVYGSLGYLVERIEALLLLSASVKNDTRFRDKFQCRRESLYGHDGDEDLIVAVPYGTVLEVLPRGMFPSEMDDKLSKARYLALIPVVQDWEELELTDDPRPLSELNLEVKLSTVREEPEVAIELAIKDILAFALTEWIAYFSSMQGVSNSYHEGLTVRDSKMNEVILELANVVVEERVGLCPVCGRPFIVKRKPNAKGLLNKKYCTDSCKVRDSIAAKRG